MSSPVIKNSRRIVSSSGGSGGGGGGTVTSVNSGTDITVDNTDPANPIVNFTGTYQDPITVVANYSALPAVGTVTGQFYWCSASQGTKWLPGALGGTYYSAGMYYSNGVSWEFLDVPYNATQAEVNTGTNTDKFVTPATLASATTVIPSTGTTGDIISFSAANTPSRIAAVAAGSYLRSAGTSTLPVWSTLVLPNSATANQIVRATSTNTWGSDAALTFNGTTLSVTTSAAGGSNNGLNIFNTSSTGQGNFYLSNDRAAFGAYGGFLIGGSAHSAYTFFGLANLADKLLMFSDGASSKGMYIGTTVNQSFGIGTNNIMRATITGAGLVTWSSAYHVLAAGTATASTAPLKFTSGTSLTSAEAGAMEFTTDDLFFTITTGAARKRLLMADAVGGLTSGRVAYATTNGRLTDSSLFTFTANANQSLGIAGANAARVSIEVQNTTSTGNASFYFQNNRGSFATYGGLLTGGSADATGNLFGSSRADKTFLISDGASSLGLGVGTLTNTSFVLGTNNTARATISGAGLVTWSAAYHVLAAGTATASTAPLKFTSGTNLTTAEAGAMEYNGTNLFFTRAGTTRENIVCASAVNSVSPTAPDRTITVNIGGTTYYIAAKTTND